MRRRRSETWNVELDYRDDTTLWLWILVNGRRTGYVELVKEEVQLMLGNFNQEDNFCTECGKPLD